MTCSSCGNAHQSFHRITTISIHMLMIYFALTKSPIPCQWISLLLLERLDCHRLLERFSEFIFFCPPFKSLLSLRPLLTANSTQFPSFFSSQDCAINAYKQILSVHLRHPYGQENENQPSVHRLNSHITQRLAVDDLSCHTRDCLPSPVS